MNDVDVRSVKMVICAIWCDEKRWNWGRFSLSKSDFSYAKIQVKLRFLHKNSKQWFGYFSTKTLLSRSWTSDTIGNFKSVEKYDQISNKVTLHLN